MSRRDSVPSENLKRERAPSHPADPFNPAADHAQIHGQSEGKWQVSSTRAAPHYHEVRPERRRDAAFDGGHLSSRRELQM